MLVEAPMRSVAVSGTRRRLYGCALSDGRVADSHNPQSVLEKAVSNVAIGAVVHTAVELTSRLSYAIDLVLEHAGL